MEHIRIDCAGISDPRALHRALADALSFPAYYGYNLDALYDCLTDLEQQTILVLQNWDAAAPWAEGFRQVFQDATAEDPRLQILY